MNAAKRKLAFLIIVVVIIAVVLAVVLSIILTKKLRKSKRNLHGAVASDSDVCSNIGADILRNKGTAVDSAIATLICLGLIHPHSSGIGGGGYVLLYKRSTKTTTYFDFRETAPGKSTFDMFGSNAINSKKGVLSVAVPGEVLAMYDSWRTQGRLSWKRLFQPTIDLARNGFKIDKSLARVIKSTKKDIHKDKGFRELYFHEDGSPKTEGEIITDPTFARTLEKISVDPYSFYNGTIAQEMISDLQRRGGILSMDDLKTFTAKKRRVLSTSIKDDILYTTSATSSGSTLIMILNILKGFKFGPDSITGNKQTLTWHRILEAFKFGYAYRPFIGDPEFYPKVEKSQDVQINTTYAEDLRKKIWNNETHDSFYYGGFYSTRKDFGTTHVSVIGSTGDAVSVTSTVGYFFGAKIRSYTTGIVYNNHMSTFSLPNTSKNYQPKASKANFIQPGKRSVSTSCPTIVVDSKGDVKMVLGGSGGLRIITGVAVVLLNKLWFGLSLEESIERGRLHHQLFPNTVYYEKNYTHENIPESVLIGLKDLGHKMKGSRRFSVVQGIYRNKSGYLFAKSDPRKGGVAVVLP